MKTLQEIKQTLSRMFPTMVQKYKLKEMGIFGSYVQNAQTDQSDVDILVTYKETPSMFEHITFENHLSDLLGVKVDLVMKSSLKKHIGQRILAEAVLV